MSHHSIVLAAFSFDLESLLLWLLIGLVAGFLAAKLVGGGSFGLVGNIIVGLLGSVIGGFLAGLLGISFLSNTLINSLIIAFLGACILLLLLRFVTGKRK